MKKQLSLLTAILMAASLVSCNVTDNEITAKAVLEELSSKKYAGRLVGTKGNQDAENYLAGRMEKMGLSPYNNDSYKLPYSQLIADPNEQNPKVLITYKDGTIDELKHGKDFYTNAAKKAIDATVPLTTETIDKVNDISITAWEKLSLVVGAPHDSLDFQVNLSANRKKELMEKGAIQARVTADYAGITKEMNNIVGVVKGNDRTKNAVVLTAHFDHVGKQGDFLFSGILDNASGTATVMETASKLLSLTADKKLDYDVVIALVNSEETNAQPGVFAGSGVLADHLAQNYDKLVNINMDCVGNGEPIYMGQANPSNHDLAEKLIEILKSKSIPFDDEAYCISDATSFEGKGYPAITVGTLRTGDFSMHNVDMKTADISIPELENLAAAVTELIMRDDLFITSSLTADSSAIEEGSDEWIKQLRDIAAQQQGGAPLKINQSMYVEFDDQIIQIYGDSPFTSIEEFNQCCPDIKIPEAVSEYAFAMVDVVACDIGVYSILPRKKLPKGVEKNKVYEAELQSENISRLLFKYTKEDRDLEIYANKHGGKLIESNEYNNITPIMIPDYGPFKLRSFKDTEIYYSFAKETDAWTIEFISTEKDGTTIPFSKDELIQFIQSIFPENK